MKRKNPYFIAGVCAVALTGLPAAAIAGTEGAEGGAGAATATATVPAVTAEAGKRGAVAPAMSVELTEALLAANAARAVPAKIATSAFARQPAFYAPVLSPDGTRFAGRQSAGGKNYIAIYAIDGSEKPKIYNVPDDLEIDCYRWAGNSRLLLSVGTVVPWGNGEARQTRLLMVDMATGSLGMLGPQEMGLRGDNVLWVDEAGGSLLLAYQPTIRDYPGVYKIDLATKKAVRVVNPLPDVWDWHADNSGTVRLGIGWPDDHHWQMVYRKDATTGFKRAGGGSDKDDGPASFERFRALAIAAGSDEGFRLTEGGPAGLTGVYRYNFATNTLGERVFEAPGADVDGTRLTDDAKGLFAAYYTDNRERVKWFDPFLASVQEGLDKAISGTLGQRGVRISSRSKDNTRMIVRVFGSNEPGRFYFFQAAAGRLSILASQNAALKPADLSISHYVHYTARDGMEIPAYLTLPAGRAAKGLPLIILPHGGPYGVRDRGDYDADAQFLANRGYVVLQPQYRGSSSYGETFAKSGSGQWGRVMQDDLDDGMDWLVRRGIVDPGRVCIVGSAYGGYAAIWGATRNPERYRCAVSFAGISDLGKQLKFQLASFDNGQERQRWRTKVQGDETFDLASVSGLQQVGRLKVPMLLVHGDKDQTVPVRQSRAYADALKAAGKAYEYYELKGEGHGFSSEANAQIWYDRLDAFLARHNPAG